MLFVVAAISAAFLDPLHHYKAEEQPATAKDKSNDQLWQVLRKPEVIIYLGFTLINGILLAMEYNFLFLFLKEGGADELLIGLHQLTDSAVELPMFFFSGAIVKYFGYVPCFCISFFAYIIRLASYSFLADPLYFVLLIEVCSFPFIVQIHCNPSFLFS